MKASPFVIKSHEDAIQQRIELGAEAARICNELAKNKNAAPDKAKGVTRRQERNILLQQKIDGITINT